MLAKLLKLFRNGYGELNKVNRASMLSITYIMTQYGSGPKNNVNKDAIVNLVDCTSETTLTLIKIHEFD